MFRRFAFPLLWILGAILMACPAHAEICGYPEKGTLVVYRGDQVAANFEVALAESPEQYRKGLMGCGRMTPGTGLLFIYPDARRRVFWMKNTPLALAIVFASPGGQIQAIEAGLPNSTRRIRSPDAIQYVLEINYAEAGQLRIGDRFALRLIPQ
jgi:uncharacterized membrane protein (UPF0127 family)